MGNLDLKRRIISGGVIPALPAAVRAMLCASLERDADTARLHALISGDPVLCRAVLTAGGGLEDLHRALERLGVRALRRMALHHAMETLFPELGGKRLDRRFFWRHAALCGVLTERIAQAMGSRFSAEAYGTGMLHDVGKLVLDLASPDGYSKALEVARTQALFVLDAERRELGVDHTLAGKWTMEYWGLPESYQAAAWLHHHPPGGLDDTLYPVELIEMVALADALARALVMGMDVERSLSGAEEQRRRLGISRDTLKALVEEKTREEAPASPSAAIPRPTTDTPDPGAAQQRLARIQALGDLYRRLPASLEPGAVLERLAGALRSGFSVPAGFCYADGIQENGLLGVTWRVGETTPRPVFLPLTGGEGMPDPVFELLASLRETEGVTHRNGLVAVPITYEGTALGQIVFESPRGLVSEQDMLDLLDFGRACGWALWHWQARQRLSEQTESLSTALWRQELAHRQALRAERLAGLGQLASGAAHVINNPLTAISGRAQMLLNRAAPEDARSLETIIRQSRRISKILSDLMQFARPSEPRLESLLLSNTLHQVLGAMRERIEAKGIRIVEEYAPTLPRVRADRHQLEQVFVNLVLNAEQSMARGGTLTTSAKAGPDRRSVVVQVTDTGDGIPPDAMDRIFEPFFTTREATESTGLGLSVCHGIIERHRGAIALHSAVGAGTTCTITLPASAETEQPVHSHTAPVMITTPPRARELPVVLIAEPDEDLREILVQTLRGRGYETVPAADGLETLATVLTRPVDMILLDAGLRGPDGAPVLQHLRERRIAAPVLMLVGHDALEVSSALSPETVIASLSKPFPLERLLGAIQETLGSRNVA